MEIRTTQGEVHELSEPQALEARQHSAFEIIKRCFPTVPPGGNCSFDVLTPRQRGLVSLLAAGRSTKEAALAMGVSPKTTETHRREIMRRLDISTIAELTKYAVLEGLTAW